MKSYETEARERYGNTAAYREHERKTKNYTKEKWAEANDGLMAIFAEFAACKDSGVSADSAEAQGWSFGGGFNEIIDGYYVMPDGSRKSIDDETK